MVIIEERHQSILQAPEIYIAHQCNCVSVGARGLAKQIYILYPYSDIYKNRARKDPSTPGMVDEPGTVIISHPGKNKGPIILNLLAQWTPGFPGYNLIRCPKTYEDTQIARLAWFESCLRQLENEVPLENNIAVPNGIGCGYGGGDWGIYKSMLEKSKNKFVIYSFLKL